MPPRHTAPKATPRLRAARARYSLQADGACDTYAMWRRLSWIVLLCLLAAAGVPRVHAQSMPPATASPVDPFHQSCVAVRALPETMMTDSSGRNPMHFAPDRPVHKYYVDLDNRCAIPPAFAPTRDIDSTSIWYVDAPASGVHAASRPAGAPGLHGLAS